MLELIQKRNELDALFDELLSTLSTSGCQHAENEMEYRKALRLKILEEQHLGTKATVMADVCRGHPDIAKLKYQRDCSEAIYKATQEAINVNKLRYRTVQSDIEREWGARNGGNQ